MHPDQDVDPPRRSSRPLILVLVLVAGILLFVSLLRRRETPEGNVPAAVGKQLDNVQLEPLVNTNRSIELDSLHGKVTLINLWGPWCGPCLRELPDLVELEQKYRGRDDVQILLVAFPHSPGESPDDLRKDTELVLQKVKGEPAIYHNPGRSLPRLLSKAGKLDGFGFPSTVLVDRSGLIRAMWSGYGQNYAHEMGAAIEKALNNG